MEEVEEVESVLMWQALAFLWWLLEEEDAHDEAGRDQRTGDMAAAVATLPPMPASCLCIVSFLWH